MLLESQQQLTLAKRRLRKLLRAGRIERARENQLKNPAETVADTVPKTQAHEDFSHQDQAHQDFSPTSAAEITHLVLQNQIIAEAKIASCFISTADEPDTGELRAVMRAAGIKVLLPLTKPVLKNQTPQLNWAYDTGHTKPAELSGYLDPISEPLGANAIAEADVLFVPALAVDTLGRRLGQGGGFYDQVIKLAKPGALIIAVVHDDEVLDASVTPIPQETHDQNVNAILTPTRLFMLTNASR